MWIVAVVWRKVVWCSRRLLQGVMLGTKRGCLCIESGGVSLLWTLGYDRMKLVG